MIKIQNINKSYESNEVLKNINLEIEQGTIFGIIGFSGAGKSTLLRLINVLEKVSSGSIQIDNKEITNLKGKDLRKLRQNIGMIFQNFNLLSSRTVEDNIAFPLEILGYSKKNISEKIKELIKLVNLEGKEKYYPAQLSGGEKQRVGIARALASEPKILLCDEATSALDPSNTLSILKLLQDIQSKSNLTIVLITHEMDVITEICNKVAVIDKGKIVEIGDVDYVFNNPQQQITKDFVLKGHQVETSEALSELSPSLSGGKFIKLYYSKQSIKDAIIAELAQKFNFKLSIIEAHIEDKNTDGLITGYVEDNSEVSQDILDFIKSKNIEIEIINN